MATIHELWQKLLKEETIIEDGLVNLKEQITKDFENLMAKPGLVRPLFQFLRAHDPIAVLPGLAIVSRHADVVEVLSRDAEFSVTEIYAPKMERTTGDFVLGMANSPQYQHEIGLMQRAVHPEDLDNIRLFVQETAKALVNAGVARGRLDVVGELSRVVPSRLVGWYFGTPGPDEATLERWMRAIFRDIFLNLGNDLGMREEADDSARALNDYLNALIAARKPQIAANPAQYDDFLSRLLKIEATEPGAVNDDTIRRILGGTIVGTVDTNSKAIAQAIDQLLDRPDQLNAAQEAARNDDPSFTEYVFEALRFNPQNPFLLRHCEKDTVIAAGTERQREIKQGSLVLVGTMSAMFDADKIPNPNEFQLGRPTDTYLHFGDGLHECFGRHIAGLLIPEVVRQLLLVPNLRRANGVDGEIRYDGAFPDHLFVDFAS